MEDFIMYEKYLEQLEEAGKIRNLKERSINCYKNYVSYFLKYQNKNPEETQKAHFMLESPRMQKISFKAQG